MRNKYKLERLDSVLTTAKNNKVWHVNFFSATVMYKMFNKQLTEDLGFLGEFDELGVVGDDLEAGLDVHVDVGLIWLQ